VVSPRAAGARVTVNNESIGAGNNHETMAGVHSSFAALFSPLFSRGGRNSERGHKRDPNKGRRQMDTAYLKSVLLWLQEYWSGPQVHVYPLRVTYDQSPVRVTRR
jgi:hypothetical protein